MDPSTLVIELLFGLLFVSAVVRYARRRDALSLDVMLIFGSMAMLFAIGHISDLFGTVPPWVDGATLAFLLAQPWLTLRLANKLHAVHRPVRIGATIAYFGTAAPLIVFPLRQAGFLVLLALGVFVLTDLLAAYYLNREALHRVGSARRQRRARSAPSRSSSRSSSPASPVWRPSAAARAASWPSSPRSSSWWPSCRRAGCARCGAPWPPSPSPRT